jgi:predicted double-glycine peptidase/guanyl-specific ribonuclease Sa/predicted  nucleic acid-binding Zn-ribbon protein
MVGTNIFLFFNNLNMSSTKVRRNTWNRLISFLVLGVLFIGMSPVNFAMAEEADTQQVLATQESHGQTPAPAIDLQPLVSPSTQVTQETLSSDSETEQTDNFDEEDFSTSDNSHDSDVLKNFEGVIRQSNAFSCGPAALATLISQLGYASSEDQIEELAPPNKDTGVSLFALKTAATELGFIVVLKKWNVDQLQARLTDSEDPVLIHDIKPNVGGHFSVVRSIDNENVQVSDTEAGNITFSRADFAHVWTGYAFMVVEDGDPILNDTENSVSDDEAKTVNGKYVPVYMSAEGEGGTSSTAGHSFEQCVLQALKLTDKTARNNARTACYTMLDNNLKNVPYTHLDMVVQNTNQTYLISPGAVAPDPSKDKTQLSAGSVVGLLANKIKSDLDAENVRLAALKISVPAEISTLQTKINNLLTTKINPLRSKILDKQAVIALNQFYLTGKKNLLAAMDSNLSSIKMSLGSLEKSIAAATSSLAQLSKSMQKKAQDAQKSLTTAMSKLLLLQKDFIKLVNAYSQNEKDINLVSQVITYKKSRRLSTSAEQSALNALTRLRSALQSSLTTLQNQILQTAGVIKDLQYQIANANNAEAMQTIMVNQAKQQKASKEQEKVRVEADKARIQKDADVLTATIKAKQDELNALNLTLSPFTSELNGLNSDLAAKQKQIPDSQAKITSLTQQLKEELAFIDAQEARVKNDLAAKVDAAEARVAANRSLQNPGESLADLTSRILNASKGPALFAAGTGYQVVDSYLFNIVSKGGAVVGYDINKVNSFPFQLGRQTGNNVVQNLAILAIAGGTGAGTAGAAAAVTGSGVCVAVLAGGGTILVPCAIEISGASAIAGAGAVVASYGGVMYSVSKNNQDSISKAVEDAQKGGAQIPKASQSSLPQNVNDSLESLNKNNWLRNWEGQSNGARFYNNPEVLPAKPEGYYKEYDVNKVLGPRDAERFVRGINGEVYYTNNHYETFIQII